MPLFLLSDHLNREAPLLRVIGESKVIDLTSQRGFSIVACSLRGRGSKAVATADAPIASSSRKQPGLGTCSQVAREPES